jgi:predicted esterase
MKLAALTLTVLLALLRPCSNSESQKQQPSESDAFFARHADVDARAPLTGEWLRILHDEKNRALGVLVVPLGAREPKQLVVAVHAAWSRADWMCGAVRDAYGPDVFIVCPHASFTMDQPASWQSAEQVRDRVKAMVRETENTFGEMLDTSSNTYFGHSQGAMLSPYVLPIMTPLTFRNVVLFEGLPRELDRMPHALRSVGAERVLLVSGQAGWEAGHRSFAAQLNHSGIRAKHVAGSFGHFFNPESMQMLQAETPLLREASPSK